MFSVTTNQILYKINCKSVSIARDICPEYRGNITNGIPSIYTFKAKPEFRSADALELRKKVAKILWDRRKNA